MYKDYVQRQTESYRFTVVASTGEPLAPTVREPGAQEVHLMRMASVSNVSILVRPPVSIIANDINVKIGRRSD